MSTATVRIEADVSAVSRAFGTMRTQYQSALQAMRTESRREAAARVALERATVVQQGQTQRAAIRAQTQLQRQASRDRARIVVEEIRVKAQAEAQAVRLKVQAERNATRAAEKGAMDRMRLARQMLRDKIAEERRAASESQRLYNQQLAAFERVERQRLNLVRSIGREMNRERERLAREADRASRSAARTHERRSATGGRGISAVGSAAVSVGSNLHGQMVDARHRRALADRQLGEVSRGAGMSPQELASLRTSIIGTPGQPNSGFLQQTGMTLDAVVNALKHGQERGSVLETRPDRTRDQAIREAFTTMRMANAEGVDPGELLAARGRLAQAGLSGDALDTAVRFTIGAAQRGSVETGTIIQQGLPGAVQLMDQRAQALGRNATPQAQARARLQAYQESVALQEVAASSGRNPGNTANTLAGLNNFLSQPRRQEMILANIRHAEEQTNTRTPEGAQRAARLRALRTDMFERDTTRRGNAMRMREGFSPLAFAARLTAATDGNAAQAMNILAGTGAGNAQSLLSPQRNLLTFLGTSGNRVSEMIEGGGITPEAIASHQAAVESDALAGYNRTQEANANALVENTGAMGRLSLAFEQWAATHPVATTVGQGAAGLGTSLLGAVAAPKIASAAMRAGSWVSGLFGGASTAATGAAAGATGGMARGAATAARIGGGFLRRVMGAPMALASMLEFGGVYGGVEQDDVQRQQREGLAYERIGTQMRTQAQAAGRPPPTADEIGLAVAAALRAQPITATVDPHTAQQVNASQPAPNGGRG